MFDQAHRLRSMVTASQTTDTISTKVIAVASGKGGVGKSNFTLNFAYGLLARGKRVVIIDADVGFANLDILMGISPQRNLQDLIQHRLSIWEILFEASRGLQLIAGGSGLADLMSLSQGDLHYLLEQLGKLQGYADYVLIDMGAGLNAQSLKFILSADELVLVSTPEPTAITDAYAFIKLVVNRGLENPIRLVINRVSSKQEGDETAGRLSMVVERFLKMTLPVLGFIPDDVHVSRAVRSQQPFYLLFPRCQASYSIDLLTDRLLEDSNAGYKQETGMKSFLSRLLGLFR